jgi:outer membrane protein OmpA-like peptidoglycan-associated protein
VLAQTEKEKMDAEAQTRKAEKVVDAKSRELEASKTEIEAGAVVLAQTEKGKMDAEAQTRKAEKEVDVKSRELKESNTKIEAGAVVLARTEKEKVDAEAQTRKAKEDQAETELFIGELSKLMVRQTDRGVIVTLGDVLFATGEATLSPMADDNIDKLVAFMNKYPNVNVLIEGYTDSVGKEKMNLALSQNRADAVRTKLIDSGIKPKRLTTKGYGENYAIADNGKIDGRKQNRRVEILLLREDVNPEDRMRK